MSHTRELHITKPIAWTSRLRIVGLPCWVALAYVECEYSQDGHARSMFSVHLRSPHSRPYSRKSGTQADNI
ncbi:uncharacterized protein LAESUDRAFT_723802 [Laetiporus sulphureus 93-53]|uniref:Uncharacterized protein n=1 Tax=Laetiporus sulphureus 93-53 TaxID=1314785 RepID=A0A165F3M6_9APHY|nr:uncharacterized protein LAESUDRAFT_723802 [Laetiporus sulphureus 93-53]KZT08312.1 hypothetical protein LAESUDRAFT_723802 [Laetiporus sulphureus 93-53]